MDEAERLFLLHRVAAASGKATIREAGVDCLAIESEGRGGVPAEFLASVLSKEGLLLDARLHAGMPPPRSHISFARCERLALELRARAGASPAPSASRCVSSKASPPRSSHATTTNAPVRDSRFTSLRDFYERTRPAGSEMLNLVRAGAFDSFG